MRIFNRLAMILLLAGLFALGIYAVVYSLGLFGYRLADLPISTAGDSLSDFVSRVENGNLSVLGYVVLVLVALVGLILLIAELKPPSPRRVLMQRGTYITRGVVQSEAEAAAAENPNVLGSSARVKARRSPGAKVDLRADVRRGENIGSVQSELRDQVRRRLSRSGVPVSSLKVRPVEADPRQARTRVR